MGTSLMRRKQPRLCYCASGISSAGSLRKIGDFPQIGTVSNITIFSLSEHTAEAPMGALAYFPLDIGPFSE
jgi:hypothetical protein